MILKKAESYSGTTSLKELINKVAWNVGGHGSKVEEYSTHLTKFEVEGSELIGKGDVRSLLRVALTSFLSSPLLSRREEMLPAVIVFSRSCDSFVISTA